MPMFKNVSMSTILAAITASENAVKTHVTTSKNGLSSDVWNSRDVVTSAITTAKDEVKNHVTTAANGVSTEVWGSRDTVTAAITDKSVIKSKNNLIAYLSANAGETQNITIPDVNINKTVIVIAGENDSGGGGSQSQRYNAYLTSPTNVAIEKYSGSSAVGMVIRLQVIEYV